ncbi:ATP-binding protein [Jannaschia ovalis]|uniref:ATP-binding protein n=1 Tax=Jannaschia ovalis TaxID=3038773 RepID=A0ABY8LBI5_9RHOB|nr:ATP-binding protein [Jannaschia sp. GRR-S6-38]WGH77519.1 ATP-binding protein [Jannaschia sp. GRR-S6-38]
MTAAPLPAQAELQPRRIPATAADVHALLADLALHFDLRGIAGPRSIDLHLLLAEVMNNIVEHALAGRADGWIELRVDRAPDGLRVALGDNGAPLPEALLRPAPPPDATAGEGCPEGGFGWAMIHALSSGLSYRRQDGINRLDLRFPYDRAG